MKRFFLLSIVLLTLINWSHTEAQAQGLALTIDVPSGPQTAAFDVTFRFGAAVGVDGFDSTDITLTPSGLATLGAVPANIGPNFVVPITPVSGQQGELTITVRAHAATDPGPPSTDNQETSAPVQVDAKPPSLTFTLPTGTQYTDFSVIFVFDEAVNGFTDDDIKLDAGARVNQLINSLHSYHAAIVPKATGTVTIRVEAGAVTDTAGHENAAVSATVNVDLPHAIMVMEPEEDGPYNEAFDVIIMFTETVDSFTTSDITLDPSGLATVTSVTGSAPTYTATITPAAGVTGDLNIEVAAAAVQDSSSVNYPASNTVTVEVDTERPTVTEIDVPDNPQSGAFDITITFSEAVYGFDPDDDITFGDSASASLKSGNDGDDKYTVTITPTISGSLTIEVDGNAAEDAAGNKSAASSQASVTIDASAPTVTISNEPATTQKDPFTVDINFNEVVNGFDTSDIALNPSGLAMVTGLNGSGTSYTATITPEDGEQGDFTIQVEAGVVEDEAGNGNDASNSVTVAVDRKKPTVLSFSGIPNTPRKDPFDVTITFSEDVTGLAADDIELAPSGLATVTGVSGSGDEYMATITPEDGEQGDLTIQVKAGVVEDEAGNGNDASNSVTVAVDRKKPTVLSFSGIPNTPRKDPFDVTITFSEDVTGLAADDIELAPSGFATVTGVSGSGDEYMARITPETNKEDDLTLTVKANAVTDDAGNANTVSDASNSIQIDTIKPTVEIDAPSDPQDDAFDITITFSENVTGFAASHITLSPSGLAMVTVTGSGASYTATITPTDGEQGDVTIQVEAGVAHDAAGNDNEASNSVTVMVDKKKPTITFSGIPNSPQRQPFDVTITFSEDVIGLAADDITLSPSNFASRTVSGSGASYTVRITPTNNQQGEVTIRVRVNAAADTAGNNNDASESGTVRVDRKKPTVLSFDGFPDSPTKDPFIVTINFSEPVKGFHISELQAAPSSFVTASNLMGGNNTPTRQLRFTPNANKDGDVTFKVLGNVVTDSAGNGNDLSPSQTVHIDTTAPMVAITGLPSGEQNGEFDVTVTFNENVTGFATDDLTITGEATATAISGGPNVYTARITPNANKEGDITIQVKARGATDTAGNNNTASAVTSSIHIDTIVPTVASITNQPSPGVEQKGSFVMLINFSEVVSGYDANGITLSPSDLATVTAGQIGSSGRDYTLTVTPNANVEGDLTVKIKAGAVTDTAGNEIAVYTVLDSIHIDTILPTATITAPPGEQNGEFDVTITFNEEVTGFSVPGDLTLTGPATASLKSGVAGASVYTVTITPNPTAEGNVTVRVNANAVTDNALNANTASAVTPTIHIDTIVPTILSITGVPATTEQNGPFDVTVLFSEDVNDFTAEDLTVTGEATASVKDSPGDNEYILTITPNAGKEGDVTLQVNANAVTDNAGNANTASAVTAAVHVDTIVPTVAISDVPNIEKNVPFDLTVTFSEAVDGFAVPADLTLTGPATASLKSGVAGASVYTVTITPNPTAEGNVTVRVNANAVTDNALNANTASAVTPTIHIDTIVPMVVISGVPVIEMDRPFGLTVTFSEPVNGFMLADLTVTGPATASLSGGGPAYTVTITPDLISEGDVTVQVNAASVQDFALNDNTASNTATIHIDTIVPTILSITGVPATTEQNAPFDVTVLFSEDVNDFTAEDLTVTGEATASVKDSPGDNEYILTITPNPNKEGDVTLQVKANAVTDNAGNANTASAVTAAVHVDTIVPTVAISDVPTSEELNSEFDVTITFSETVTGFTTDDIMLNNFVNTGELTATVTAVSGSGASYTATITPNSDKENDITLRVKANAVTDAAGNNNTASAATSLIHIDTILPTVSITGVPSTEQNAPFDITITFNEDVAGFQRNDLTLTGEATLTSLSRSSVSLTSYTATITPNPTVEGDVTVRVNANAVRDAAGNFNSVASNTVSVHVDTIVPTVVISGVPPPLPEKNIPFNLTITFSEAVNGFSVPADLTLTGSATASLSSGAEGDSAYVVTITPNPTAESDVTVQVNANAVQDLALNANTAASNTATVHVDTIVPTVVISGVPPPLPEKNIPFNLTITFSEAVNEFSVPADLTVTGPATASLTSGSNGAAVYTVTITPNATSEGNVTVQVNASAVQDFALNNNTASAVTPSVHVDTIVPTVTISSVPPPLPEKNIPFNLTITFSEAVNGFAVPGDLTVTGPATASLTSGVAPASVYTVTITPNANAEGDVTVQVNANAVQDLALNDNTAASNTPSIHIDTIVPTVAISGAPLIEKNVPFDLTVAFSEAVNGFVVPADLTLTGPATASLKSGVAGASVYVVTITPNPTAEGDVTVRVNANTVQDLALNANTAPSAVTPSVHVDTIVPTVAISGAPGTEQNGPFILTVTFSETVNGFAVPADLTVTGPATASLTSGVVGASVYTVTITPNPVSEGDVTVQVNASAVQDPALNGNTASVVTPSVHIDTIVPTVVISGVPPPLPEKNIPFDLTITFSEPVNGFAATDLTLTGPATAALSSGVAGASVYTVTITPNPVSEGDVTVQVNANAIQDLALNANTAASAVTPSVHVDTIVPTVVLADVPVLEKRNDIFDIKVVFSEAVNGFQIPADMTINGPVTASLTSGSDGDAEYTVTITPNPTSKGDLTFQVNAAGVQDLALNNNIVSEVTDAVRIDTVPPIAEITDLPTIAGAPFDITITFNEEVTGFASADIALTGPATATLKSGVDGDTIYTATITPNPNAKGDVRIQIPAGVVKDLALNENIPSEISAAVHVDTNALTVQITDVPETVQLEAFSVMIKFSMDVADFVLADITLSGDAAIQTSNLTGRGSVYLLKITPDADTDGAVTIQVPAGVATDAASNSNTASILQTVSVAPKWMPAAGLRDATREVLGLDPGEDFEREELKQLTTLTSESSDIRSLTGLEAATNLTALDLSDNAITDITVLVGLTKLTMLDLSGNAITDITVLAGLTELTTLNLSGNAITDITVLAGLTKLTTLNLSDNPISSLNPLSALTSLTTLELSGNAINDLTVISGLTGLLTLDISDNSITDITLLQNLTALTTLDLSGNTVSNLITLAGLTQLTSLYLNSSSVSDLTALGGLTNLTTLELADNAISTLNPITTLQRLTLLDLSANNISDVSTLASLANLMTLRLMGNPILDTKPLYPLTQRMPPVAIDIAVSQYTPWDVNADGSVDAVDSALVTAALGQSGEGIIDTRTDVNGDGTVDNADLLLVTENFDNVPGAPAVADILRLLDPATLVSLNREVLETELQRLVLESDGSLKYQRAIELLQRLLAAQRPEQTRLFANYPNPFNPETWIPYQLAVGSKVALVIYDVKGVVVRHLELGHQPAGYYTQKNRAAYWDGRNVVGERVASGIYFYQLQANNVSLLRKMVILK